METIIYSTRENYAKEYALALACGMDKEEAAKYAKACAR